MLYTLSLINITDLKNIVDKSSTSKTKHDAVVQKCKNMYCEEKT